MTPPAASAAAAPAIHPRRTTSPRRAPAAPRRPRRVSGPARPARSQTRSPARAVGLAEAVATHRLLDRLIRGRLWIGVIAFALIGIVTMQLVLLKLNAGIGRSLVHETLLQRENATLSAENSEVAAGEQVEAQAEHAGMEPIPSGTLRFLTAHPSTDVSKAAAALSAPIAAATSLGGEVAGGEAAASNASTTGEATAPSSTSTGEEAAASSTSTGGATTTPAAATTEAAATPSPATTTEAPASNTSTVPAAAGASEAASQSTPATSTLAPSTPTSTGGGTTPGG